MLAAYVITGKPLTCLSLSFLTWKMGRIIMRFYWAGFGDLRGRIYTAVCSVSGCPSVTWFGFHLTLHLVLGENLSFAFEDPFQGGPP